MYVDNDVPYLRPEDIERLKVLALERGQLPFVDLTGKNESIHREVRDLRDRNRAAFDQALCTRLTRQDKMIIEFILEETPTEEIMDNIIEAVRWLNRRDAEKN